MGLNTLNNRSNGQTILDTFFNDIHSALNGDFVGRNSSGVPTAGQNLGTTAIPFGTVNCNAVVVDGATLDPSLSTTPQNIVISGKARSTSRQAAFITPNGAALSLIISATATNLALNINGTAVSVVSDITKTGLTAAPSSNNTCLVDESTAAAQFDTRKWGGVAHRKNFITVDTMGSSITALVGTFAAFKISTEYFIAFVESSTKLSKIRRGYFYDSSLNPLNPVAFSNNDVITLMKLGYIFVENDGATADVTYTAPAYDYVAPAAPTTGDYWYDQGNSVWKRYDGASWVIINRTYVGMFVSDSTNCVAARAEEFYKNYESTLSLDLEVSSVTVVRNMFQNSKVHVYGRNLEFPGTHLNFDITAHLASSVDIINATEQASTMYYLYLSDLGERKISDIEPLYFGNKRGWYHPHNTWRCVGLAYNDGSSNLVYANAKGSKRVEMHLNTTNGHGAVNTRIRRLTNNAAQYGASAIYSDSANSGTAVEIFEAGFYVINTVERNDSAAADFGVSRNSTQLTTSITSITATDRVIFCSCATTTQWFSPSGAVFCRVGDILRPHTDGGAFVSSAISMMRVQKVDGFLDAA